MRQVFCPMSFVYGRRWSYPLNDLTRQLRSELLTQPFETITFAKHRNDISPTDNYHPKSWFLCLLFWLVINIWHPFLRTKSIAKKAEEKVCWLIDAEDENSDYSCLGPVNSTMNTLVAYIRGGKDSHAFKEHLKTLPEFLWVNNEGMLMNGTNGVQCWDTSLLVEACNAAGLTQDPKWTPMLTRALEFLDDQQIREECRDQHLCYRQQRKGAWGFSTQKQGYCVSDCTSEGLKATLLLQSLPQYPKPVGRDRIHDAVDVLLTMQNASGGCASYEPTRGSELLEHLNAAEVFGRIMIEYDYPECTTSVITALHAFQKHDPSYRAAEIAAFKARAVQYIRDAQAPDGSWYGSWGICFSYAAYFALEALACAGETYENSERVRRACTFFLDRQMEDGGWGETYRACETGVWCQHPESQVVQTAWIVIALVNAQYPDPKPLQKALRLIMSRQLATGEWPQEAIEGVFNKSWFVFRSSPTHLANGSPSMISYPNYKFIFPIMALGKFARRFGDEALV
jgi:lanosterol synthase